MTTDFWTGIGNWVTDAGADWSLGSAPSSSQDAVISSGDSTLSGTGVANTATVLSGATLTLSGTASLTLSGALRSYGAVNIDTGSDGGASVSIAQALIAAANVTIGNSYLDATTTVTAKSLWGGGTVTLWGNQTLGTTEQTTLDITGAAPVTLNQSVYLHGDALLEYGSGGIATIASGVELQIDGQQSRVSIGAGTTNSGLATLRVNFGTLDLEGDWNTGPGGTALTTTSGLVNRGTLELDVYGADGASSLTVGGVLTNSGTVTLGNTSLTSVTTMQATGLANSGTVNLWGNETLGTTHQTTLDITGAAPTTLTGSVYLHGDALLELASSLTAIGYGAFLQVDGQQSRVSVGAGTTNSGLASLAAISGTFDLEGDWSTGPGGASVMTTVALKNHDLLEVDVYGGDGASSMTIGGALYNTGTVSIGNTTLSAATTVTATALSNTGTIILQGNATSGSTLQATLDITGAAPSTAAAFTRISGDALLEYASGAVTNIDDWFEIDGAQARASIGSGTTNSALAKLASNHGTFLLRGDTNLGAGGATVTTTTNFTNFGIAYIDAYIGGDSGSRFTIGGALFNCGTFDIGNAYITAATTVTATSLDNAGTLYLQGATSLGATSQATLDITGAASAALASSIRIGGDALLEFASGSITTIVSGARFELDGAEARAAIGSGTTNSALTKLAVNHGTFTLRGDTGSGAGGATVTTTVAYTNYGTTYVDAYIGGDSGSQFTIGGALNNDGTFNIGNDYLTASTTVTATSLVNDDSLSIQGNTTAGTILQATLDITGAAPSIVTAAYTRVGGDALLEFASGGIATIASSAWFELDGSQARASIGAGTTNSALAGLSTNHGTFTLRGDTNEGAGGVALTTTVAYTNFGTTYVDAYIGGDSGSQFTIGGALNNDGTFNIGNSYLTAATTVTATTLVNDDSLTLQGAYVAGATAQATLDITGVAPVTVVGAYTRVSGDALLEFASGGIGGIVAGVWFELDGSEARASIGSGTTNSALTKLASNHGTFTLRGDSNLGAGGSTVTTTVAYTNYGTTYIDAYIGGDGGSQFTIGGTLYNDGAFEIGNSYLAGATTVTATSLVNDDSLTVQGNASSGSTLQATLDITGAAPSTAVGVYTRISGDALLEFASGGINTVAANSTFELDGSEARVSIGVGTTNSALTKLATNNGTLSLRGDSNLGAGGVAMTTTVAYVNDGTTYVDGYIGGDGGSQFTIGGALYNFGTFNIGNSYLAASTNVTATSLVNDDSLTLQGNASSGATSQATLDITQASPVSLTGFIRIGGDALLEFASGGITSVAAGASFELDGSQARTSIGAGTTNSALAKLAANYGTLTLRGDGNQGAGGAMVTTTTTFTNFGNTYVDAYGGDAGSEFTIGGALTNDGTFDLGNSYLTAADSATATSLSNGGTLNLYGESVGYSALMTISGQASNSGTVTIGAGATLSVTGSGNSYTQTGGTTTVTGSLSGAVNADGGLIDFTSALTSASTTGAISIADGGTVEFGAGSDSTHTVTFADPTGTLELGSPDSFNSVITGFTDGDVIDLLETATTTFTYSGHTLDVYDGSTVVAALDVGSGYSQSSFSLVSDGNGGTSILDPKTTAHI